MSCCQFVNIDSDSSEVDLEEVRLSQSAGGADRSTTVGGRGTDLANLATRGDKYPCRSGGGGRSQRSDDGQSVAGSDFARREERRLFVSACRDLARALRRASRWIGTDDAERGASNCTSPSQCDRTGGATDTADSDVAGASGQLGCDAVRPVGAGGVDGGLGRRDFSGDYGYAAGSDTRSLGAEPGCIEAVTCQVPATGALFSFGTRYEAPADFASWSCGPLFGGLAFQTAAVRFDATSATLESAKQDSTHNAECTPEDSGCVLHSSLGLLDPGAAVPAGTRALGAVEASAVATSTGTVLNDVAATLCDADVAGSRASPREMAWREVDAIFNLPLPDDPRDDPYVDDDGSGFCTPVVSSRRPASAPTLERHYVDTDVQHVDKLPAVPLLPLSATGSGTGFPNPFAGMRFDVGPNPFAGREPMVWADASATTDEVEGLTDYEHDFFGVDEQSTLAEVPPKGLGRGHGTHEAQIDVMTNDGATGAVYTCAVDTVTARDTGGAGARRVRVGKHGVRTSAALDDSAAGGKPPQAVLVADGAKPRRSHRGQRGGQKHR